ncbi:peptidase family M1 [Oesophagostomum dentatum]|uniref:Peptidase family M1 n=1 Tax=Oesophagostomum dentatum TaxID=61180 RepID=A0A0B1SLN3_OESDE|nr:peptidase family M1 [Oesophagostomum dentatum]
MVVSEYYLKIRMYYPAPGITYQEDRNMTFDGYVSMPAIVRKPTSVLTLNMLNIQVQEVEVKNVFEQRLNIIGTSYDETKQQFSITLDKPLRVGSIAMISITYSGLINPSTDGGLFYTYYYNSNNEPVFMVATQLAPMDARRLFPCMDEPEYKAVRSFGWTGQKDYLKFSAETAGKCLYQMGKVTKIKFKMEKCDHLGLPELSFNAMENYGLVIYRHHLIAINFKVHLWKFHFSIK